MRRGRIFGLVAGLIGVFGMAVPVRAGVVINEIYPNPDLEAGEEEWIEVYNPDDSPISLNNWQLDDNEGGTSAYKIGEISILPKAWLTFTKSQTKIGLNNDGDYVRLFNADNQLVDQVVYGKEVIKNKSFGRQPDGGQTWSVSDLPTKNTANNLNAVEAATTQTNVSPAATTGVVLRLSEIMACPNKNEPEWIEVINGSGNAGTVENWQVQDARGTSKPLTGTVTENGYLAITFSTSFLNNDGDQVKLIDPKGNEVDRFTYTECETATGWANYQNSWQETTRLTPGSANAVVTPVKNVTVSPSKEAAKETLVTQGSPETKKDGVEMAIGGSGLITSESGRIASVAGIIDLATKSAAIASRSAAQTNQPKSPIIPVLPLATGVSLLAVGFWPLITKVRL